MLNVDAKPFLADYTGDLDYKHDEDSMTLAETSEWSGMVIPLVNTHEDDAILGKTKLLPHGMANLYPDPGRSTGVISGIASSSNPAVRKISLQYIYCPSTGKKLPTQLSIDPFDGKRTGARILKRCVYVCLPPPFFFFIYLLFFFLIFFFLTILKKG